MRPRRSPAYVILGLAFGLRAAWVLLNWYRGGPALSYDDEALHWQLATNLIDRFELVSDDGRYAARMPVYPLFLALFAWAGESGILLARLAQCVCGAAVAGCVYGVVRDATHRRAAAIAGVLAACNPFGVFFANLLLTEVLFSLMCVALLWALVRLGRSEAGALTRAAVATLPVLLVLTRPSAAGWALGLVVVLPVFAGGMRRALPLAGASVAVGLVLFAVWGGRNAAVIGGPALLSANGGVTLYDAQGPQADGSSNQAFLAALPDGVRGLPEIELDRYLRDRALEQMRADPGRVAELAWVKFKRTWNPFPNVAEHREGAAAWAGAAYTVVVLLLAVGGLVVCWRSGRAWRLQLVVWSAVGYFTLVHAVYIGSVRYRVPLMPLLCVASASVVAPRGVAATKSVTGRR